MKRQKFKTHRINVNKYNRNNINDNTERINVKNKIEESQETVSSKPYNYHEKYSICDYRNGVVCIIIRILV